MKYILLEEQIKPDALLINVYKIILDRQYG
ncbi:hypothetical protein C825_000051 [Parabacteroides sp. ASF519]|uniref:Uncharacterized protein n=1 Tax=Parabacteroides goldsteinii dnLKV18 TaxID=1235789 RepID=S0GP65_9BACT|nr:hypothetical protein C803_04012 [Parabacteroides goldsteinii dnLKV18]KAI4367728.1 hypothetical protein C825_000094 [Parabacteroides sp. ASF519]KAI4367765.1 hypothetical protein C825_000084 [Parabacteroides sp. ASF519]KAI4367783.1 hypothetical protein C825_000051 [Parabacteroides sp. ASF519]